MADTLAPTLDGRRAAGRAGTLAGHEHEGRKRAFASTFSVTRETGDDGKEFVTLTGYASTVEQNYKMFDWYGEYDEKVAGTAFDKTLAANPDVAYLLNHTGMTMARTVAGTLDLSVDEYGLLTVARVNPKRSDVADLLLAVDDGAVDQMSFAFRIVSGHWSPDYMEYTIDEVDLDRGDVSAVNYGANPFTNIGARSQQAFDAIEHLSGAPLIAARDRINARLEARGEQPGEQVEAPTAVSRNGATIAALLEFEAQPR